MIPWAEAAECRHFVDADAGPVTLSRVASSSFGRDLGRRADGETS